MKILINTTVAISEIISITSKYENDIDVKTGRFIIDGKSLLGLYSLDLSKPVEIKIHTADDETEKKFYDDVRKFEYKSE